MSGNGCGPIDQRPEHVEGNEWLFLGRIFAARNNNRAAASENFLFGGRGGARRRRDAAEETTPRRRCKKASAPGGCGCFKFFGDNFRMIVYERSPKIDEPTRTIVEPHSTANR